MTGVQDKGPQPPHERGSARIFGRRKLLQTPAEALQPEAVPPPPNAPNSERWPILSALSGLLSLSLVAAMVALFAIAFGERTLSAKGPLQADKVVFIAPGTEVIQIIDKLNREGVIDQPSLMKLALWTQGKWPKVKAGEYLFKANISHSDVIDVLVSGKQLLHSVTIPEGLTSQQIVERLKASEILAGDIREVPAEGSLLPETYKVARGMSRSQLIRKMKRDQDRLLTRIWNKRAKDLPLKTKYELLTLAAIVEKETGKADERSRVAAVFYNRLRKGMRLQSDPTIVYGLVGGKGTLGRPILRSEIRKPTSYNTYVIPALPPGPIANPGRAALEATANPSKTNDLYFVADGTGGHAFAETLEEHNNNVQRWRQIEKERKEGKTGNSTGANGGPAKADPGAVDRVAPDVEPEQPAKRSKRRRRGGLFPLSPFHGSYGTAPERTGRLIRPVEHAEAQLTLRDALRSSPKRLVAALPHDYSVSLRSRAGGARKEPSNASSMAGSNGKDPGAGEVRSVRADRPASSIDAVNKAAGVGVPVLPRSARAYAPQATIRATTGNPGHAKIADNTVRGAPGKNGTQAGNAIGKTKGRNDASAKAMKITLSPGIEAMNLQIIGVTPDVTDSPLDGPINTPPQKPVQPASAGNGKTVPMAAAKRAALAAAAARHSRTLPFQEGDIDNRAQEIPDLKPISKDALKSMKGRKRAGPLQRVRRPVYDASAGTKHDPLKARRWDLNAAHSVPRIKSMER